MENETKVSIGCFVGGAALGLLIGMAAIKQTVPEAYPKQPVGTATETYRDIGGTEFRYSVSGSGESHMKIGEKSYKLKIRESDGKTVLLPR